MLLLICLLAVSLCAETSQGLLMMIPAPPIVIHLRPDSASLSGSLRSGSASLSALSGGKGVIWPSLCPPSLDPLDRPPGIPRPDIMWALDSAVYRSAKVAFSKSRFLLQRTSPHMVVFDQPPPRMIGPD